MCVVVCVCNCLCVKCVRVCVVCIVCDVAKTTKHACIPICTYVLTFADRIGGRVGLDYIPRLQRPTAYPPRRGPPIEGDEAAL